MKDPTGPYVTVAALCERVLQEKDGVLSIIRLVDRVTIDVTGPQVPESLPPSIINLFLVLSFKSGSAKGRHAIKVSPETPAGERMPVVEVPALFEGEDRGVNVVTQVSLEVKLEGLYWIDVFLDGDGVQHRVTRIPLRIVYQPIRTGTVGGQPPSVK